MDLTREKALELHRQMFSDMQKELGNNASPDKRDSFKQRWCKEHFSGRHIRNHCFLCQYATEEYRRRGEYINMCKMCCPIDWEKVGLTDCCDENWKNAGLTDCSDDIDSGGQFYYYAPLDKIISLPERVTDD